MLNWLLEKFGIGFNDGALFVVAAIVSFFIMILFGNKFIVAMRRWQKKGQPISENLPTSHLEKRGTPTVGGLMLLIAAMVSAFLFMDFSAPANWIAIGALMWFGWIGFADDYKKIKKQSNKAANGLSPRFRLIAEGIGIIIIAYFINMLMPFYIPSYSVALPGGYIIPIGILYFAFAYFVIAGSANAVNISDGLDGLSSKLYLPVLIVLFIGLLGATHTEFLTNALLIPNAAGLYPVLGAVFGAVVGFLWFNAAPAQIFMGDTGSLALGGFMGTIAMLLKIEVLMGIAALMMVLILLSSFIQTFVYKLTKNPNGIGKRVFLRAPLHHHFEEKGIPETKITDRFFIMAMLFSGLALILMGI
ncbi:MAG: phospho-N-acetylmuramoyl-pentapeptide-transferase [Rickettsiales bacterium]|jgi:phospho-N-acetylmuramoyl-pentapeptide-transferase|nr:phospho-N-acetylmuramoyl-pentapeptide-transferase [Rickettsiales bacterium]